MGLSPAGKPHTASSVDDRRLRPVLLLVFAASGFAGLIYESVWTHYLKLFLGHAAHAQTLVLAIFMGGIALGSWVAARRVSGLSDPLRGYAVAEGLLGVAAFLFHPLFAAATSFAYDAVLPALPAAGASAVFRWSLAALLILPQSVVLGTTFPLMAAGLLRRRPGGQGSSVSLLYFANSIGGVAGVLCSGFLLVRLLGLPGTLAAAGLVNLAVAAAALAIAHANPPVAAAPAPVPLPFAPAPAAVFRLALAAAAVTGAASFVYEIVWVRLLALVLGTSTHAFELMLSAFILGLALGSLWVRSRVDRIGDHLRVLAGVQVLMGVLALATLPLYGQAFRLVERLLAVLPKSAAGYGLFLGASHGIALAVMLPATLCAGMTLPLITTVLLRRGHGERSVGIAYAANTLGGIAGVFLAVHVAIPLLGLRGALLLGAAMDAGLGLALAWAPASASTPRWRLLLAGAAACALALFIGLGPLDDSLLASGVYRTGTLDSHEDRIVARRDGKTATVHVVRQGECLSLRTNGKGDAGIGVGPLAPVTPDERTTVLLAALPLLMRPEGGPVANVGMGSGLTSHELLASARVSSLDTIEIEPAVAELARHFQPRNERVFTDARSRVRIEDAKAFFAASPARYGIVVSEPSAVWVSGNASLFTREFYRQVRDRLDTGGLFAQWLHLYEIGPDQVVSILKAFDETFPDWAVYLSNDLDAILIGVAAGELPPPSWTPAAVAPFAADLARTGLLGPADLQVRRVADRRSLGPLLRLSDVPVNSDYRPYVDQRAGRARFLRSGMGELSVLDRPVPAVRVLGSGVDREPSPPPGYSPDLGLARKARTAALFFREVRDRPPGAPPGDLSGEPPDVVAGATRLLARCAFPGPDALGAAYAVAIDIAPFLSPPETATLWEALSGWPCVQELSPPERPWVSLFRAVGALDARAMAERGTALALAGAAGGRAGTARYALACALLGKAALGDAEGARSLWEQLRPGELSPSQEPLFRLVLAHVGATP